MTATWRLVWVEKPYLRKTERLNDLSECFIDAKHLKNFQRNKRIYRELALGATVSEVAVQYSVSAPKIHYIMTRALCRKNVDESLAQGLLPYTRINRGSRKKAIPLQDGRIGKAYVFSHFLDTHPYIKQQLIDAILLDISDAFNGRNLTPKSFHELFIRLVRTSNIPESDYPLSDITIARESCRLFLRKQQRIISAKIKH